MEKVRESQSKLEKVEKVRVESEKVREKILSYYLPTAVTVFLLYVPPPKGCHGATLQGCNQEIQGCICGPWPPTPRSGGDTVARGS